MTLPITEYRQALREYRDAVRRLDRAIGPARDLPPDYAMGGAVIERLGPLVAVWLDRSASEADKGIIPGVLYGTLTEYQVGTDEALLREATESITEMAILINAGAAIIQEDGPGDGFPARIAAFGNSLVINATREIKARGLQKGDAVRVSIKRA